jgi:hypothetical protein
MMSSMDSRRAELLCQGFVHVAGSLVSADGAFARARDLIDGCSVSPLSVVGDFVLPPPDGAATRDFQMLHLDFGLPIDPKVAGDVARYTALYVDPGARSATAVTRLVPLALLLGQRAWPSRVELVKRLAAYGVSHGAWADASGYQEGSLARIIEAAVGGTPRLPSVKADPSFLCGTEFDSLRAELAFFKRLGLDVERVQTNVALRPGELLVFDNLRLAHGRRGARQPGELHQRIFGHKQLGVAAQRELRDGVLSAFDDTVGVAQLCSTSSIV